MTCALAIAAGISGHSHAQLYKWVDENGKVQYSDTVPPNAVDRARKELRNDGTIKRETQRAASAEERRLAALKAVEDAKLKLVQDERDRKDKALLSTYTDLADFDRVRNRALAIMDAEYQRLIERETLLKKVIALPPGAPPMVVAVQPPAPEPAPVAGKAPPKSAPPKPTVISQIEARSEMPRLLDAMARKKRDREDVTAMYARERVRLANLIAANNAALNARQPKAVAVTPEAAVSK
ncbi:MAG: DUF4124 domain-containing protein [Casimicrobium sp.]